MFIDSYRLPAKPGRLVAATSVSEQVEEPLSLVWEFGDSQYKASLVGFIFEDAENASPLDDTSSCMAELYVFRNFPCS